MPSSIAQKVVYYDAGKGQKKPSGINKAARGLGMEENFTDFPSCLQAFQKLLDDFNKHANK
jgi:hypothetical protein